MNAVQIGGYEPCTVTDFEIPKKYGLRQTIGDTMGIGGIFRALRTIPVVEEFAHDAEKVCPNALFINYVNPMTMITGYLQKYTSMKTVGLCHSVQYCVDSLLKSLGMYDEYFADCKWEIAGINHMAWLLKIQDKNGIDLYPEIKRRSLSGEYDDKFRWDLVRHQIMYRFGYYNTESSEHTSEYHAWFIKSKYPELIEKYNIPLDEYPRRCVKQINEWKELKEKVTGEGVEHTLSREFAAHIMEAMITDQPYRLHGNVLNKGFITNLPENACVEVPCMVDRTGIHPVFVGALPEQCAALNRTNINVQNLVIEAAHERSKEKVYMAAYLDPHMMSELSLDDIKSLCDDMFAAHGSWIPEYK